MRWIIILALVGSLWAQSAPNFPNAPQTNPSLLAFGPAFVDTNANCTWVGQHLDYSTSNVPCTTGGSLLANYINSLSYIGLDGNGGNFASGFVSTYYEYAWDFCTHIGLTYCDSMWLHVNRDYFAAAATQWGFGDLFDMAENQSTGFGNPTQAVHGAFTNHSGTFTDVTCRMYAFGSGCPGGGATPVSIVAGDTVYLGYYQPFDQMNFVFTTPASGATVTWQYSTGSGTWGSLSGATNFTDGTSSLTVAGAVTYYPPSNWARDVVNGSKKKYWVRFTVAASGVTFTSIKGDTGLAKSACTDCGTHTCPVAGGPANCANMRGWSQTAWTASTACSGSPCTVDGQPYNPSPPNTCPSTSANVCATAKFPYWGRADIYGGSNNTLWPNPDTFNGSVTPANNVAAQQLAWKAAASGAIPPGYTALTWDNVGAISGATGATPVITTLVTYMDFHCGGSCNVNPNSTSSVMNDEGSGGVYGYTPSFQEALTLLHAEFPAGFKVLYNANSNANSTLALAGDLSLDEFALRGVQSPQQLVWQKVDDMFQASNTNGTVQSYQMIDAGRYQWQDAFGGWHISDDGDRAPIVGLAMWYMAAPWCTTLGSCYAPGNYNYQYGMMGWGTSVNAVYNNTAEVAQYTNVAGTLAAPLGPVASGTHFNMVLTGDSNVTQVGGNNFATLYQFRLCPTPTTCNLGDKFAATKISTDNYADASSTVGPLPIVGTWVSGGTYPIGTTVQFATTTTINNNPMPAYNQIWMMWALWWPAMGFDIGKPDPNGYNAGVRTCGSICATTQLPSPPTIPTSLQGPNYTCIGHAGTNGCLAGTPVSCSHGVTTNDSVWRRDYTKAVVLVRNFSSTGCVEDFDWPGQNITLSTLQTSCSPTCTYNLLHSDGTTTAAGATIQLRAGEGAILIPAGVSLPIGSTLVQGRVEQGRVQR